MDSCQICETCNTRLVLTYKLKKCWDDLKAVIGFDLYPDKGVIKETWIAKIKEIGCWMIKELITFCPFSPVSAWSKKLPNFAVKHVDLS